MSKQTKTVKTTKRARNVAFLIKEKALHLNTKETAFVKDVAEAIGEKDFNKVSLRDLRRKIRRAFYWEENVRVAESLSAKLDALGFRGRAAA